MIFNIYKIKMTCVSVRDLQNLFPSKLHAVIFVAYMGLFINQGESNVHFLR